MKKALAIIIIFSSLTLSGSYAQNKADSLLSFIKNNKSRASLFLQVNDTTIAHLNENKLMPLASTVKILIALEFAKQAGAGVLDAQSKVGLDELDKYYLMNTDGDAHPSWIRYEQKQNHIKNDSISLLNVARGMIIFSSNANTEFLMDLLGLDNVKNNIQLLGLKQHTAIYPFVSALFMYQNPKGKDEGKLLKSISRLSDEQYSRYAYDMHKALKYNDSLKAKFRPQDLTIPMQHEWSNRLPASTTAEYVRIMKVLNNRKFFSVEAYKILENVLESIMENPANQSWLTHAGMKGGSTMWVLTKALYATTKENQKIEMAYFFNELTQVENEQLQSWMNSFELQTLESAAFRKKIGAALAK